MSSAVCRRNSMTFLSLLNLETFTSLSVPIQTKRVLTSTIVNENRKINLLTRTKLEDLPNELLIFIFQYLSPYDLHRSLYNLNFRLNTICHTQKLHLDLACPRRAFDYYCHNQQPFASQIHSLKLDDHCDRLASIDQYINIERFTNLRALTIKEPSPEHLDAILPKLHTLSYLSYLNIDSVLIQSRHITVDIFKIRSLKYVILHSTDPINFDLDENLIHPFTELEYLEVSACSTMEFLELLKYVGPNIKRMKIRIPYDGQQNQTLFDQLLSDHRTFMLLRRLDMKLSFLSLANFHSLLRLFPHLTHLTFSALTGDTDFMSPSIWYEFISTNLIELKHLQFYINIMSFLGNVVQYSSSELIDSFYSHNSKWLNGPVIVDNGSSSGPSALEFYTYSQRPHTDKYTVELYGTKRYVSTTAMNFTENIDKNIQSLYVTLSDDQPVPTTNQELMNKTSSIYPAVISIFIYSKMTRLLEENDKKISLIICDIMKSIPDSSKIVSLNFLRHSSINSVYPPTSLIRRLLDKLPKLFRLQIAYEYLLRLLKSPIILLILRKKIQSLTILFDTNPPLLPDMIQILKLFSINLRYLYIRIQGDLPVTKFYCIIPLLFSGICKRMYSFQINLSRGRGPQLQIFDEQFKLRLKRCLAAQVETKKAIFGNMEYRIKDTEFTISF